MGIPKQPLFLSFAIVAILTLAGSLPAQSPLPAVRTLIYNQISSLTASPGTPSGSGRQFPAISANGNKLVFSQTDSSGSFHIYAMNIDGTGQTQLDTYKPGGCCPPALIDISADGSTVVSADPTQIRIAGRVLLALNDAVLEDLRITGDGSKVYFTVERDTVITGKNTAVA